MERIWTMDKSMLFAAAASALTFAGCVSYTGISDVGDDLVDEANQPYAGAAQKAYIARLNAPARPVVIREAPGMGLFLNPTASGHPLCQDLNVRKELAVAFKGQLRDKVAGMKDFKLVDEAAPVISVVAEGDLPPPQNYVMTYNITSIELREGAVGNLAAGLIGRSVGGNAGQMVADQRSWDAIAKVEVRLFKPNGTDCIFSFVGDGVFSTVVGAYNSVTKDLLLGAVSAAVDSAMADYIVKFGPPIYVTDTCQNGRFARLSVGSKFGVLGGQRVEFYRNKVRAGLAGQEESSRQVVGTGVVGGSQAPVENDGAWVLVNDYDESRRTVFRWTSARILPSANK